MFFPVYNKLIIYNYCLGTWDHAWLLFLCYTSLIHFSALNVSCFYHQRKHYKNDLVEKGKVLIHEVLAFLQACMQPKSSSLKPSVHGSASLHSVCVLIPMQFNQNNSGLMTVCVWAQEDHLRWSVLHSLCNHANTRWTNSASQVNHEIHIVDQKKKKSSSLRPF